MCFFPCVYSFTYPLEGNKTHNTCPQCITILGLLNFIKAFYSDIILVTVLPSESEQSQEVIVLQLHGFQYADNISARLLRTKKKKKEIQDTDSIYRCPFWKIRNKSHIFCFIDNVRAFDFVYHNKLWKILKEMEIPDHSTCLLRNLYAGQEATVRTGRGTTHWFQIGNGVHKDCILSPDYLTYMQSTS